MCEITIAPKENAYHVNTIFIDDEPWKDIHTSIFGRQELELISTEQFEILEVKKVKAFVYKKLSQKNYSSFELKKILKEYLVSESVIESVIKECKNLGYINDKDFLETFIRSAKAKNKGPEWILQKLMLKGLKRETCQKFLETQDSSDDRVLRIKSLLETRYKTKDLTDFAQKQKVIGSLARKGYSFEDIKSALKEHSYELGH